VYFVMMSDFDYIDDHDERLFLPSQSVFQSYNSSSPSHSIASPSQNKLSNSKTNKEFSKSDMNKSLPNNSKKHNTGNSVIIDFPISTVNSKLQKSASQLNKIDRTVKKPFLKKGR
jgi:hypothetical protein